MTLLGSTGSIGTQAIQVIRAHPNRYRVIGLSAGGTDLGVLASQAVALRVETVAVARGTADQVRAAVAEAAATTCLLYTSPSPRD